MLDEALRSQLAHPLRESALPLGTPRRGKVRDVYDLGDRLLLVASDRLSAFDVVLTTIPCKGQILTQLAAYWFERTKDVCPNHVVAHPDPAALVAVKCAPLPVEVVVRGHLTGSLWRDYASGRPDPYDLGLPKGLRKDEAFERPILTPTTKAEAGAHDEPLSSAEVVRRGLVPAPLWDEVQRRALALFERGRAICKERGLLLVDTKYEFGLAGDRLLVIDEIHTPDSSRFWEAAEYEARFAAAKEQQMLDKENIRQWLLQERGFSGHGTPPAIPDEVRLDLARKYAAAFERITGKAFVPDVGDPGPRLEANLRKAGLL